jgi:pseudouridine-5'-monophosphatase
MAIEGRTMKVTSIIYDCDGVLLDTEPIYTEAANIVLKEFNKTLPLQLKLSLLGQSGENVAKAMVSNLNLPIPPEEYKNRAKSEELTRFHESKLMKGAEEAVSIIVKNKIPLAIATSSLTKSFGLKTWNKTGFISQFEAITKGDEVTKPKPDPEIYETTFSKLKALYPELKIEECLVIEDSPSGIRGALRAGMQCFWLIDSIYKPEWYDQFTDLLKIQRFKSHGEIIDKLAHEKVINKSG